MDLTFIYIIEVVIFIYVLIAFAFNYITGVLAISIIIILIAVYILTIPKIYDISDKQWKMFAIFGAIITVISLLINGINTIRNNSLTEIQNLTNFYKYSLEITRNIEDTFMRYPNELGYLMNDIYQTIGKNPVKNYSSTRDLDLEYLAALKIFKAIETVFLVGFNVYGIQKITDPDFQGVSSTMHTMFTSKLMKNYWVQLKPLFQDEMAAIFDSLMIYGRVSN